CIRRPTGGTRTSPGISRTATTASTSPTSPTSKPSYQNGLRYWCDCKTLLRRTVGWRETGTRAETPRPGVAGAENPRRCLTEQQPQLSHNHQPPQGLSAPHRLL